MGSPRGELGWTRPPHPCRRVSPNVIGLQKLKGTVNAIHAPKHTDSKGKTHFWGRCTARSPHSTPQWGDLSLPMLHLLHALWLLDSSYCLFHLLYLAKLLDVRVRSLL